MSKLERYVKDVASAICFVDNNRLADKKLLSVGNIDDFCAKCIKNYAAFRLELLTDKNSDYVVIKREVVKKLVKLGIKYACTRFGISLSSDAIDNYVDKYIPVVMDYVTEKRIDLFTGILEANDRSAT